MKTKSTVLCILTLSLFMLFSLASSGSSSSPRVVSNGNSNSGSGSSSNTTTTETTQVELVTPCQFTYNNIGVAIETEFWDSIPNDTLGIYTLPSGQRYLVVGMGFANGTNSDIFVSSSDFQVYADNRLCEEKYILDDSIQTMATISSGRESINNSFSS